MTAFKQDRPASVSGVVYSTAEGAQATVTLDSTGRPSLAVVGPQILIFGSYSSNRADVGLVNVESGEIRIADRVDVGVDFGTLERSGADSTDLSPAQAIERAGYGATALICSMASMSVLDAYSTHISCRTSTLLQVATRATEQADWEASAELLGFGLDSAVCDDYGDSCLEAIAETSGAALADGKSLTDRHTQNVAQASGVVRFGGTWAYRDSNESWFVVEQELVYDIVGYALGDCYFIRRLEPLSMDGNVFRYNERESGNTLALAFDRVGPDVLAATRVRDGTTFKWDRTSPLDLASILDNECHWSSAPSGVRGAAIGR